jgi:ferric-chelate reductase
LNLRIKNCADDQCSIFLVAGYYHTKDPGYNTYIWPAFVIWAFDRLVRVVRILINNTIWRGVKDEHSHGTVELITEDTIRLTLRRPMNWKAGQHAYVLLPSVSTLPTEAHPFSISTIPGSLDGSAGAKEKDVTFLIRTRTGFTGRMRAHALKAGKFSVPAFIDGPYGNPPDLSHYSTNILISGGDCKTYARSCMTDDIL